MYLVSAQIAKVQILSDITKDPNTQTEKKAMSVMDDKTKIKKNNMKGQEITEILFMLFGSGALFSGLMVITSKNPMHSVFYLVLTFANVSMLLILLGVEFLALLFLIVYVGAIAILFLFVVMMLNIKLVELFDNSTRYIPIGFIIGAVFITEISKVLIDIAAPNSNNPLYLNTLGDTISIFNYNNISSLGYILYTEYWLYFLMATVILLIAMIGAIVLTLGHEGEVRRQDIFVQVSADFEKTIKMY